MGWGGEQLMTGAYLFRAEKPGVSRRGQQGPDYATKKTKAMFVGLCLRSLV